MSEEKQESQEVETMTVLVPKVVYADQNFTKNFKDFCVEEN